MIHSEIFINKASNLLLQYSFELVCVDGSILYALKRFDYSLSVSYGLFSLQLLRVPQPKQKGDQNDPNVSENANQS